MRNIGSALTVVLAALLLVVVPAQADVYNVSLSGVGDSGISGTATTIAGNISGPTPYSNVEVNVSVNKMPSENMVYEGWLVDNDSNYKLSLGVFNGMRLSARQHLPKFGEDAPYDAIAVSREPANDTNPMPATVVAMGNLPGTKVSAADFTRIAILPADETFQRQLVMERYGLSSDQAMDFRMNGWSYSEIALAANAASQCNRPATEVASMLQQGRSWEQIAQTCNTSVAKLLEPVPSVAVAGFIAEARPGAAPPAGMVQVPVVYQRYANGRPIVTQDMWQSWRKRGYSWRDVAVAANIAAMTGENVDDLLRTVRVQGKTWRMMAFDRGLDADATLDVSGWPFSRNGEAITPMPPEQPAMPSAAPPSRPAY